MAKKEEAAMCVAASCVPLVRKLLGRGLFGLFVSVDDSLVNSVPTCSVDAPIVGGVLVAIDSNLASLHFFVSIDTHFSIFFII